MVEFYVQSDTTAIPLGRQGENLARVIYFELTEMIEEYGDGTATLVCLRSKDNAPYVVTTSRDGVMLTWSPTSTDTAYAGQGKCELRWVVNNVLAKSIVYNTTVLQSITGDSTIPSEYQSWYDAMVDYLNSWSVSGLSAVGVNSGYVPTANGSDGWAWAEQSGGSTDPSVIAQAVSDWLDDHPEATTTVQDYSLGYEKLEKGTLGFVTPEMYGAVGDGTTDDTSAVQAAMNASNNVHFTAGKTYYLASPVSVSKDISLHGNGATIKTVTPDNAAPYDGIVISGTLKTTTTLTTSYIAEGDSDVDNISNRFTLADMSSVAIGDILYIKATDQYFSYSRRYYYLGAVLVVTDIYDGHIYTNRNMPWDITLSNSLSVAVYSAPDVTIDNLKFMSDLDCFGTEYSLGNYAALLKLSYCKNFTVSNCDLSNMKVGISANYCVNGCFSDITLSKSRYDNSSSMGDGYGLVVNSCTHTVIQRILSLCSQGCVDMGGDVPNIDTYVSKCDLSSECRAVGVDMHDNSYNMVIEDCVLGGLSLFGTAKINRCQFIRNVRGGGYGSITFRGFADPKWANLMITNCTFPKDTGSTINFRAQEPQDYVQSYDSIIGTVLIENCVGGAITYDVSTSAYVLSNTINSIIIRNWTDCNEIFHKGGSIKYLEVNNSSFIEPKYINKHGGAFSTVGIDNVIIKNVFPSKGILYANLSDVYGARYELPEGIGITVSSDDSSTVFITCGENLASGDSADFTVGQVLASTGNALTRTKDAEATAFISDDGYGNLVYTIPSGYSTKRAIYPAGIVCANAEEDLILTVSTTIKNTGSTTNGSGFRPYIVVINCETGLITYAGIGSYGTATAAGLEISHYRTIPKGHAAFWYFYNYEVVAESETTFENTMVSLTSYDAPTPSYKAYIGNKRTGNGTLTSIVGQNNIMCTSGTFDIQIGCNYAANPIGMSPSAEGVSF